MVVTIADEPESPASEITNLPPNRLARRSKLAPTPVGDIDEPDYVPPDFSSSWRTRIGSSFIEQFVAGHDANDVLRELVQNEYDGGGERLTLTFGSRSLEVIGSGRNVDRNGWERLSVIVGTGNVIGSRQAEMVAPKRMASVRRISGYARCSALATRSMCARPGRSRCSISKRRKPGANATPHGGGVTRASVPMSPIASNSRSGSRRSPSIAKSMPLG